MRVCSLPLAQVFQHFVQIVGCYPNPTCVPNIPMLLFRFWMVVFLFPSLVRIPPVLGAPRAAVAARVLGRTVAAAAVEAAVEAPAATPAVVQALAVVSGPWSSVLPSMPPQGVVQCSNYNPRQIMSTHTLIFTICQNNISYTHHIPSEWSKMIPQNPGLGNQSLTLKDEISWLSPTILVKSNGTLGLFWQFHRSFPPPPPPPPPHTMLGQCAQSVRPEATLYGGRGEGQVWEKEPLLSSNRGR